LLQDEDVSVRRSACKSILNLGEKESLPPLGQLADEEDWWIRQYVFEAMAKLRNHQAVEPLITMLSVKEDHLHQRIEDVLIDIQDRVDDEETKNRIEETFNPSEISGATTEGTEGDSHTSQ
jgi:hypothetical protein